MYLGICYNMHGIQLRDELNFKFHISHHFLFTDININLVLSSGMNTEYQYHLLPNIFYYF